jgi:hypothetical protein
MLFHVLMGASASLTRVKNTVAVADWDLYEKEIDHAFEQLYATPSEHPVMFNDEAWSSQAQRRMQSLPLHFRAYTS